MAWYVEVQLTYESISWGTFATPEAAAEHARRKHPGRQFEVKLMRSPVLDAHLSPGVAEFADRHQISDNPQPFE